MTQRARIQPQYSKTQYSKSNQLLTGYRVVVEGGETRTFKTRQQAESYIIQKGYAPAYTTIRG